MAYVASDQSGWRSYVLLLPYLFFFGLFLLWPIVDGLRVSLMEYELVSRRTPRWVGLRNYAEAFADPYFRKAMWATVVFVAFTTPLTIGASLVLSLGLQRIVPSRRRVYRTLLFLPGLLTISVVAVLWRWIYNEQFGPLNELLAAVGVSPPWLSRPGWAMASIVLMTLWWTVGGPMIILLAGLGEIPEEFYEAADLDGATGLTRLWHITLPLLKPALLFVLVLNLIGSFQVFGQTFLVTGGGPELSTRVLVHYIFEAAFQGYRLGYGSAMSWLLFLVIAVFSVIQARLMREK